MRQISILIVLLVIALLVASIPSYAAPPVKDYGPGGGGVGSAYFGRVQPKYETTTVRVYTNQAKANAKINATARTQGITVSGGWKPVGKITTYTKVDPTIYSAQFRRHAR